MSNITISYFPLRGRAEPAKLLLEDNGVSYKFNHIQFGGQKSYASALFGQLPVYEEESDGKQKFALVQSSAILHFVAKKVGVYPFCPFEAARSELFEHAVSDLAEKYVGFSKFNMGTRETIDGLITKFYGVWEKLLADGKHDYINDRISFGDYSLFHILDVINETEPKWLESHAALKAHHARMKLRPGIQAYFKSDRFIK
jgi:glutathione S-transferase